jgi:anthranilate phosphoribosyltransferase
MASTSNLILKLTKNNNLSQEEAYALADDILKNTLSSEETVAALIALKTKGETSEELSGFSMALKKNALVPLTNSKDFIDVCGTGGDQLKTFNISTTVAFVLAACGLKVAKHGNRSVSSQSGSADVLAHLGMALNTSPETQGRALDQIGMSFLFAPAVHPLMKNVMPLRKALGIPTIFNLIGPLSNPLPLTYQVIGVYKEELMSPLINCMKSAGIKRGAVIFGCGGMDELSLEGTNDIMMLKGNTISKFTLQASDYGLVKVPNQVHACAGISESAASLVAVLKGHEGPHLDIVLFNAAFALYVAEVAKTIDEGIDIARDAITKGRALAVLNQLCEGENYYEQIG